VETTQVPHPWINKWYSHIHTGILSSLKKKEILTRASTLVNLKDMLSEISQTQKEK
jgi:hypothetical protein